MRHGAICKTAASLLLLASCCPARAVTTEAGWIPVRVDDGTTSHCINQSTEAVSLDLKRVITEKQKGWFTEGKQVDLVANVSLSGRTGGLTKTVTLPRAYSDSLQGFPGGRFSVGDEESLVSEYILKDGAERITGLHVDVAVANEVGNSALTDVLLGIADSVKTMPLPPQALTALSAADTLSTNILNHVLQDSNSSGNFIKQAGLQLNFSPTGACTGTYELTGSKALIKSAIGAESDGIIDIGQATQYCYRIASGAVYAIQFTRKVTNGSCPTDTGAFKELGNPYIAFYLNADPAVSVAAGGRFEQKVARPSAESLARCVANGTTHEKCNAKP